MCGFEASLLQVYTSHMERSNTLTVLDKTGTEWRPDEVFSSTCTSAILDESRASSLGTAFESLKHGTSICTQLVFQCEKTNPWVDYTFGEKTP